MSSGKAIALRLCPACGSPAQPPSSVHSDFDYVDCGKCGFAGPRPLCGLSSREAWNVIAEALAGDLPWVGDGPTVEEAGGRSILVRHYNILEPAFWSGSVWFDYEGRQFSKLVSRQWMPTGWQRMPKPRA